MEKIIIKFTPYINSYGRIYPEELFINESKRYQIKILKEERIKKLLKISNNENK